MKRYWIIRAIALLSLILFFGAIIETPVALASLREVQWSYQSDTGPDRWSELDSSFALCNSGKGQSPINLTSAASADLVNPDFHYQSVPLNILNNGHTVQVPYAPGSYMMLEGDRYNLLQFHFHSPSEHAVEGKPWDAELHLVHQNDDGELAVVAVLLQKEDESNLAYRDISNNLPASLGDKVRTETTINAFDLLPSKTTTYQYSGSLTTPPCSEAVTWLVMTEPVSLSKEQLKAYERRLNHNNRPLQVLNSRTVQMDISP